MEACNCHRKSGNIDTSKMYENRYFADHERNNYITYISKYGSSTTHGHWDPKLIYSTNHNSSVYNAVHETPDNYLWQHKWPGIISDHLAMLQTRPRYVILNSGLWNGRDLNVRVFTDIRKALDKNNMIGIYKTTTRREKETNASHYKHDEEGCAILHACLDLSWTANVSGPENYFDQTHFSAKINRRFNEQLLRLLIQLEMEHNKR